jgi:Zn-dependent peptidase ImmA (M78 family)
LELAEFRAQPTPDAAFTLLREKVEAAGVFVLLIGNLGSHHSAIGLELFRGFAVADDVAPFVVINDQDAHSAWSFTLLHELTHLWLGQTGVSGSRAEGSIERFCNDVASEFLLPAEELTQLSVDDATDAAAAEAHIQEFARHRNLSGSMVAYKLYRAGAISFARWEAISRAFREHWVDSRAATRQQARSQEGGPSYYVVRRHRVGDSLIRLVDRMMAAGALTTTKAGAILSVKPQNVHTLLNEIGRFTGSRVA